MARVKRPQETEEHSGGVVDKLQHVDAILTGDIHLRDDTPVCRTDNYWEAQSNKIAFIRSLQEKYNCPILDSGDLFGKSKPSPYLLGWAIRNLPYKFYSIPGNHDLPEHSLSNIDKSGFGVLKAANVVEDITGSGVLGDLSILGIPWGEKLEFDKGVFYDVAVIHTMTFLLTAPWPGCTDPSAEELLDAVPASLILTGHNHTPFVVKRGDKLLVNPGSLMRSTAAQAEHRPRVYLYNQKLGVVCPVYLPIDQGVVSREHIDSTKGKEERLDLFVSRLHGGDDIGLNFKINVEQYISENRIRKRVRTIIEKELADAT
jgi:DNA repair exonuclease SbcCD nuclease subunit